MLEEKESPAALSNAYHWTVSGSRCGADTHPHVAQSAGKKSMSAIVWLYLILRIYIGPTTSAHNCMSDIVLIVLIVGKISAIPGSPEFVSIRKLQLWVMLKSDAVLQAESWNRTDSGRTGTTWTGLLNAANVDYNRTTRLSKPFQRYVPTDRPTGRPTTASLPHRQRGVS